MFVAVGRDEARSMSEDGRRWSAPERGEEHLLLKACAFGDGVLVVLGSKGKDDFFQASRDGRRWDSHKMDSGYGGGFGSLAHGNGTFLGFGGQGSARTITPFITESKDGVNWSAQKTMSGSTRIRSACYGMDRWVGVGDYGRISVCTGGDLTKWEDVPDTRPIDTMIDVTMGNDLFVGVGLHGLRRWSADGKKWSEPERGREGEHLNSVVWTGNGFVAVGAGGTYASPDGKRWERRDNENAPTFFTFDGGRFVGIAWKGRVLYSEDSLRWEEVFRSDFDFQAVTTGRFG